MQEQFDLVPTERVRRAATVAWLLTLLVLAGMFVGTHLPMLGPPSVPNYDKLFHFGAYFLLTICLLGSWELSAGVLQPAHYFVIWLFCTLYGLFDEVTQIPFGRTCDGMDWLADILGIVTGLMLFRIARPLMYRIIRRGSSPALSANSS